MRRMLTVALALTACSCVSTSSFQSLDDPRFVSLEQISERASELDGQTIRTFGLVFMSDRSRNVVSKKGITRQVCVGLLVTEAELKELSVFDGKWLVVEGRFDKQGCGGDVICHDSCGPYTIANPVLAPPN